MSVRKGNPETFEWWSTHVASIIGKIPRDGVSASQAAAVLGLDPGDFQVAPAYTQPRGKGAQQQQQQQRNKAVLQHRLKDKRKGKPKNGKSKANPRGHCLSLPALAASIGTGPPEGCSDPFHTTATTLAKLWRQPHELQLQGRSPRPRAVMPGSVPVIGRQVGD